MSTKLTQERLKELLHYDPETGVFTWKVRKGRSEVGSRAGTRHNQGYRTLKIDGVKYLEHRCAWLYAHGAWPAEQLDHKDGDRGNSRLSNLRECSSAQNHQNQGERTNRRCGTLTGAVLTRYRWRGQIRVAGVNKFLGHFDTELEAHQAYLAAKAKYHTFQPTPRTTPWKTNTARSPATES